MNVVIGADMNGHIREMEGVESKNHSIIILAADLLSPVYKFTK